MSQKESNDKAETTSLKLKATSQKESNGPNFG